MVAIGAVVASGAQEVIGTLVAIGAVGVLVQCWPLVAIANICKAMKLILNNEKQRE